MSMLTPPGMGGKKNRITGDRYPRMRRPRHRRRIALVAIAAAGVLGLGGWGTLQLIDVFSGNQATSAHASQDKHNCANGKDGQSGKDGGRTDGKPLPQPSALTVNVYNATPRGGLAKETADELKKRGFKIGKVGNAPAAYDKKVKGAGMLLGAPAADGSLKVLATQLAGAEHKTDARKGADVDLIIGDRFKTLTPAQDAQKALAEAAKPSPAPSAKRC